MTLFYIANIWVNFLIIFKYQNDAIPEFSEVLECGLIIFTFLISLIFQYYWDVSRWFERYSNVFFLDLTGNAFPNCCFLRLVAIVGLGYSINSGCGFAWRHFVNSLNATCFFFLTLFSICPFRDLYRDQSMCGSPQPTASAWDVSARIRQKTTFIWLFLVNNVRRNIQTSDLSHLLAGRCGNRSSMEEWGEIDFRNGTLMHSW